MLERHREITTRIDMSELIEDRAELELAYGDANVEVAKAQEKMAIAKAAVIEFDIDHPEVMAAVKAVLNKRKQEAGEAARKQRESEAEEEAESEGGDA